MPSPPPRGSTSIRAVRSRPCGTFKLSKGARRWPELTWRSSAAATATRTDGGGSPSIPSPRILTVCAIP
eukprot:1725515-Rhodomonas_salina.1